MLVPLPAVFGVSVDSLLLDDELPDAVAFAGVLLTGALDRVDCAPVDFLVVDVFFGESELPDEEDRFRGAFD